ncbi:hypothetical protein [Teredinibacter turnerae]|uniref:hypothetical protein n=1 Tax=Teredinibacter turnerae TaxID=2426 RepID=UPI000379E76E|nr:hypothetical protein [Teredinibacter turnerae]
MINVILKLVTKKQLVLFLISGALFACASNNRSDHITSIGIEDLTQKKPVNVIIYHDKNYAANERVAKFDLAAIEIANSLKALNNAKKIRLNNAAIYTGDWKDVADLHFNNTEYNWTLRFWDSNLPTLSFQNFSLDIDSSIEVHFRYCQERMIQFANLPESQYSKSREFWIKQFYPAAIHSLYLLMKGNKELTPIQVKDYSGRMVNGTKLGENADFIFVLNGETEIYIVPKLITKS